MAKSPFGAGGFNLEDIMGGLNPEELKNDPMFKSLLGEDEQFEEMETSSDGNVSITMNEKFEITDISAKYVPKDAIEMRILFDMIKQAHEKLKVKLSEKKQVGLQKSMMGMMSNLGGMFGGKNDDEEEGK